jgi:hypothetical protein
LIGFVPFKVSFLGGGYPVPNDLPDADPQGIYWTIGQLVARRNSIVKHAATLKNQLHQQLSYHYPSYKKFFCDIDGKAALAFLGEVPCSTPLGIGGG